MMASQQEIEYFFELAKTLTIKAAEVIRKRITEIKEVETKSSDLDLVTKYDKEVEDIICGNLSKKFPDHKFIGEETSYLENEIPQLTDSPTWIIDPIDGTTNFVHSFPQTCISIALAINKEIVIGIIYNPSYDEMFTAIKGQGAFLNGKPIRPSSVKELKKSLISFEPFSIKTIYPKHDIALARLHTFISKCQGLRSIGSAALSLAYVANGRIDVFQIDGLMPWDVAAGFLIVTEAGGTVIDTEGGPFNFMVPKIVAAANKDLAVQTSQLMIQAAINPQWKFVGKELYKLSESVH